MNQSSICKKIIVAVAAVALLLAVSFAVGQIFGMKDYAVLYEADTLNIYSGGQLLKTVAGPANMLDTFQGTLGIGVVDSTSLGVKGVDLTELYALAFLKDGKTISTIQLLTPKNPQQLGTPATNVWAELEGKAVIMGEKGHYFLFGAEFFSKLEQVLREIK